MSVLITSCSLLEPQKIQVETRYILAKPTILEAPSLPPLKLDPVIVLTPQDAQYYQEACESLTEASVSDSEKTSNEAVGYIGGEVGYLGLDIDSACNWAVYGYTVQGWLNLEQQLLIIRSYVKEVESQRKFYQDQLLNQYQSMKELPNGKSP